MADTNKSSVFLRDPSFHKVLLVEELNPPPNQLWWEGPISQKKKKKIPAKGISLTCLEL